MSIAKNLYDRSPEFLQTTMVNISGSLKSRQRYGAAYTNYRNWLTDYDKWDIDRRYEHQSHLLQKFVKFATDESSFYRTSYKGIDVDGIISPNDLKNLPVLEKDVLREQIANVYTVSSWKSTKAHTGGTTGNSLIVRYTHDDQMLRMAILDNFKSRHGFENRQMKRATFSGKHIVPPTSSSRKYWRFNKAVNQMLYSTFHISEKNMWEYIRSLNEYKPAALDGYFTPLCDLANFIERHSIKLEFTPLAIFPTAETTTERGRELLERVFQARVYDQYASSEGAPIVTECVAGNKHLELLTGIIESVPDSNEIIVTSFQTHGTPLIRYKIGDSMEIENDHIQCDCGLATPRVTKIYGRSDDFLLRADGVRINSVHISSLLKHMPNSMIQAQIRQERLGEILILMVVDESKYKPEFDSLLKKNFHQSFGDSTHVDIKHVSEIPREKSGKHRLIKNLII